MIFNLHFSQFYAKAVSHQTQLIKAYRRRFTQLRIKNNYCLFRYRCAARTAQEPGQSAPELAWEKIKMSAPSCRGVLSVDYFVSLVRMFLKKGRTGKGRHPVILQLSCM